MIVEYNRPRTIEAAVDLLSRTNPKTVPLGGGTVLSRHQGEQVAIVDLQELGLNQITQEGNLNIIGAAVTLQQLSVSDIVQQAIRKAAHREVSLNLRQVSTLAGTIVTSDGRSILSAVLLAADSRLVWQPGSSEVNLGDYLPLRTGSGRLISEIRLPSAAKIWFETVSRTPDDLPIIVTVAAKWPSGRTRIAVGGFGRSAILAMDGTEAGGAVEAVRHAVSGSDDEWASAEYRMMAAEVLIERCLERIEEL